MADFLKHLCVKKAKLSSNGIKPSLAVWKPAHLQTNRTQSFQLVDLSRYNHTRREDFMEAKIASLELRFILFIGDRSESRGGIFHLTIWQDRCEKAEATSYN